MVQIRKGELRIFVGHSQDALAEANVVYALEARFQRALKLQTKFMENPPFNSVRVWEWNYDARGRSGGQEELVDPALNEAHFAVFVFKERIGKETWNELDKCRERRENRPPIAAVFPAVPPHPERLGDRLVSKEWTNLLDRKHELSEGFGQQDTMAIRPLDAYKDHDHLCQIVLDQFKRDLGDIIQRAKETPEKEDVGDKKKQSVNLIYGTASQISFDRSPVIDYPLSNLDQTLITNFLQQPQVLRDLRAGKLSLAPLTDQLAYFGLTAGDRPSMGLFLCCAPRSDIVDKFSGCSLRLVVYSETTRASSRTTYMAEPAGNLLSLFDEGMQFFDTQSGLTQTGTIGSTQRDDLEIPTRALREALVNALIHRDYETREARGQPTRVEVYPDRVEISSYGGLMKGISLEDMNEAAEEVHPLRRNEVITKIFAYNQLAELNASGIARIHFDLRERDLPKPLIELVDRDQFVKIILYRPIPETTRYNQIGVGAHRPVAMISSSGRDLPEHREQVRLACERAGFEPREMMEHLPTLDTDAVNAPLGMVDQADVYIGIFAYRYGYVPDGQDLSVTEMEYNRAVEKDKPRLIFFIHEDHPVTGKDFETGAGAAKLEALKTRIGKQRVAAFFKSPGDLRGQVLEALTALHKQLAAEDTGEPGISAAAKLHRRTVIPVPPTPWVAHPYTLLQVRTLVGRQTELSWLTDWVATPDSKAFEARLFCFVAIGGMGKSALTWQWFQQIAPQEMQPLAGRLWWSFYESDASFENFSIRALTYVSGQKEKDVRALTRPDCEAQLLSILDEQPFLLVLDGLERILLAYHRMDASYLTDDDHDAQAANYVVGATGLPAPAAQSFVGQHRLRQTTDPRAGTFLQKLAQVKASRILVSTRLYPAELQVPTGHPRPGCFAYFLPGLSDDAALEFWRALGVSGSRTELLPIFRSVQGHPLLVQALASEVATYRPAPGDFSQWRADHPQFDPTSLPLVQSRTHILEHALAGLTGNVREVLRTLVGFRMAANYESLEALLVGQDKTYPSAQGLDSALAELEDRGLIGWDREANRYDAHRIVRGVVWQLTDVKDQQAVYSALEAHFEPMVTPDADDIEALDDLTPAIERYHTLVGLGRYDDAYCLFKDRLDNATLYRLAAHRERIEWLERLFPEGVEGLPALTDKGDQAYALNTLALSYQFTGQPGRTVPFFRNANEIHEQQGNKSNQQFGLSNLGNVLCEIGALREAVGVLRQALVLNRELKYMTQEAVNLEVLGWMLGTMGDPALSRVALERSQRINAELGEVQSEGVTTAHLAERSLWLSDFTQADALADRAWALAGAHRYERDFIHAALLQGRAALGLSNRERADERLHLALTRARAVNVVEFELPALIAIAALEIQQGDLAGAKARLDDVWDAAARGPYPLRQADAYNVLADLERVAGNPQAAMEAATKAYQAAWCDGPPYAYHWGLETARVHLAALDAPDPEMPAFDASAFAPLPEVEINPKDEHWIDPAAFD